jgi:hypothetical protein
MTLSPAEMSVIQRARQEGLIAEHQRFDYLDDRPCMLLSIALAPLTLGISLLLVPILWVVQHDRNAAAIARLKQRLQDS